MTNLPAFSVIFSAYTTLLVVNEEGQFETHCDAKPYLEELKASRNFRVKLIAGDLPDERVRFLAENPSVNPDFDLQKTLTDLYGANFFEKYSSAAQG